MSRQSVKDFVDRMTAEGRKFEINGQMVAISPTDGLKGADIAFMAMSAANLRKYLKENGHAS